MASYIPRVVIFLFVISLWFRGGYGFFWPSSWWGDDDSGASSARNGWTPWIEFEDSSGWYTYVDEGDSSVDLEDLVLTISLDGPPKTAKPTTLATTTTDSTTTTKPKPKPPPKG